MAPLKTACLIILTGLLFSASVAAHKIYAPNDIPLFDNRFRIDPNTEQVTIILNHNETPQKIVLVQPDGSKLYAERHPKSEVAWLSNRDQDIITVQSPMPGPWQAIATLHGDNRIQLLNPIILKVDKLPLKLYHNEYLTTHVSLLENNKVVQDTHFLNKAKLSVSLVNPTKRLISMYKDDGQHYDALPFDGKLTTHLFIDLTPGRYLLNIKTQNNIFIRTYNQDAVVFPSPVSYKLKPSLSHSPQAELIFAVDTLELIPGSITVDGTFTSNNGRDTKQSIVHFSDQTLEENTITISTPLDHGIYNYTGKVFATTTSGREISFELPERIIELRAAIKTKPIDTTPLVTEALPTDLTDIEAQETNEVIEEESGMSIYIWWILAGLFITIILGVGITLWLLKRKNNISQQDTGLSLDELTQDDLQPTEIDESSIKNNRDGQ